MKVGFVSGVSEETFKIAAQAGLECVELGAPPSWFSVVNEACKEVEKVKAWSKQYGISIASLLVGREIAGVDLRAKGKELEKQLEQMARKLDICKALGPDVIYCFTGPQGYNARKDLKENVLAYKETYTPVAELAAKKGVKVAFENCPGEYPFANGTTLAVTPEAWELMFEALPSDYIGLEFDPSHLVWQFVDVAAAAEAFKHKIFIVHAKDTRVLPDKLAKVGSYGQGWWIDRHPGWGDTPWPRVMMSLHEAGFNGALVIEHLDTVFGEARRVEGLRLCANYLRKCMML